jgi:DNA-binding NtrC family response regulator
MAGRSKADEVPTITHIRYAASPLPERGFRLRVVEGPDAGRALVLDGSQPSRVLVGKSEACELCLTDGSVSRRHASFEIEGPSLHLVDLGSTNGTFVGSLSVRDAILVGGETVRLGATTIAVEADETPPNAPALTTATSFGRVAGISREMRALYPVLERLAASSVPAILEGETGTGKEVLAEALHERGPRVEGPFIVFDCTAVPPTLVESELFGHERGAFTGAVTQRRGVFEQAHDGTLLIDEIGDLEPSLQPKLLRALERGEVRRVGGDKWIRVNVRVVAATRRDLDRAVHAGRFRDDLFHRLAVARVELPPLRKRGGDIPMLAELFALQLGGAGPPPARVLAAWNEYAWPGNVRELRNAVARWIALGEARPSLRPPAPGEVPGTADFIDRIVGMRLPMIRARQRVVDEFEQRYIARVLNEHGGNVGRAAAASGIARRYFQLLRARAK